MTSLADRPATALLVVYMQHDVVARAHEVEDNINALVVKARAEQVPVIWAQHTDDDLPAGSDGWKIIASLHPEDDEAVVQKSYGNSFEGSDRESFLHERQVGRLVVTGTQTDACIRSTLHEALARGYDTTLVADGHTTEDMRNWGSPMSPPEAIAYTNLYWSFSDAPGRSASAIEAADVEFV